MKTKLTAAPLLLAFAAGTAVADDDLISPCFSPTANQVIAEALGLRVQGKTNQTRYNFIGSSQTLYYGITDWLTLTLGGYEAWDRARVKVDGMGDFRTHYREVEYEGSVMLNGAFSERDFVSLETHFANNRNSRHEHESQLEWTGYYMHQGERFTPFIDFGIQQSVDQGRDNDLEGFGDIGLYTKLTENSGVTVDLAISHQSATGQRAAATLNIEYGYQVNDHLGVIVGVATNLRDSGRVHFGERYDRVRWSTGYHAGLRYRF